MSGFARHIVLLVSTAAVATPFVWMIALSFMPETFASRGLLALDQGFSGALENYAAALTETPLPRFLLNGAIICAVTLSSQILFGAPLAFALAKAQFPGRRLLISATVAAVFIPRDALVVPLFFICYRFGILETYAGLVFPSLISPTAVFLLYQVFRTIPDDIINAARLDGLSSWRIVWRLMVPISAPTLAAITILAMVGRWNDLFWPSIAVTSVELMPPPQGLLVFSDVESGTRYGPLMAAATITTAPLLVAFLAAQQKFIASFSGAGFRR